MFEVIHAYGELLARVLLAIPFLHSALEGFRDHKSYSEMMRAKKIPLIPVVLPISLFIKIVGATFLILGVLPQKAAVVLFLVTFIATMVFHDYWKIKDPVLRKTETYWFTTNVGLMGGLLFYAIS